MGEGAHVHGFGDVAYFGTGAYGYQTEGQLLLKTVRDHIHITRLEHPQRQALLWKQDGVEHK